MKHVRELLSKKKKQITLLPREKGPPYSPHSDVSDKEDREVK